jgi:hypothetical protein
VSRSQILTAKTRTIVNHRDDHLLIVARNPDPNRTAVALGRHGILDAVFYQSLDREPEEPEWQEAVSARLCHTEAATQSELFQSRDSRALSLVPDPAVPASL